MRVYRQRNESSYITAGRQIGGYQSGIAIRHQTSAQKQFGLSRLGHPLYSMVRFSTYPVDSSIGAVLGVVDLFISLDKG